jgi:hypothetical protein
LIASLLFSYWVATRRIDGAGGVVAKLETNLNSYQQQQLSVVDRFE